MLDSIAAVAKLELRTGSFRARVIAASWRLNVRGQKLRETVGGAECGKCEFGGVAHREERVMGVFFCDGRVKDRYSVLADASSVPVLSETGPPLGPAPCQWVAFFIPTLHRGPMLNLQALRRLPRQSGHFRNSV